eukprot:12120089-Ditylum_brightwellii.AAC.1
MERSNHNKCVEDDNNGFGVDDFDDSGDKHLTHLSQAVDCCLMERIKKIKCVDDNNKDGIVIVMIVEASTSHIAQKWLIVV